MDTSVVAVVINWKDSARTLQCVKGLLLASPEVLVVVVDNETSGELAPILASEKLTSRVELIPVRENKGFAGGMNEALTHIASWDYSSLLAINNDASISDDALSTLLDRMASHPEEGIVAPLIVNSDGSRQSVGSRLNPWTAGIHDAANPGEVDYLTWACVLLRRSMMDEVGKLDERFFMYWEDVDYGMRAKSMGWKISVELKASVAHELSASRSRAGNALTTYYVWGLGVMAKKWGGAWRIGGVIRALAILAKRVVKFDFDGARAVIAGIARWSSPEPRAFDSVHKRPVSN